MAAAAKKPSWFEVDKEGLAQILRRRGIEFALLEPVSNALDTAAKVVDVHIEPVPGRPLAEFSVEDDDPDGFRDLRHAFTLFAPSEKKADALRRGRFNLGEKLVLAICEEAEIISTTGAVHFDGTGRSRSSRKRRASGSVFRGLLRMTRQEIEESVRALRTLLVPEEVRLTVCGEIVPPRDPVASFETSLPTEIADAEGNLRRSRRTTTVFVYEPLPGEQAALYELGIPVVETGDRYHIDIGQKVPLNLDRDNVPPGFLREVRAHVLNAVVGRLTSDEAASPWAREAVGSPLASEEAVRTAFEKRFGEKRVAYDPSDPEGSKIAVASGYAVVAGGSLSTEEWESARRAGALPPAGQVTPSPKPFGPGGRPLQLLAGKDFTPSIRRMAEYFEEVSFRLIGRRITVQVADDSDWGFNGTYGREEGLLRVNLGAHGKDWFDRGPTEDVDRFLLHELSHEYESDHLARGFADAGHRLGARLKHLALEDPEFFRRFEV